MKKFLLFTIVISISICLNAQTASIQFINNSADEMSDTVDIYINNVKLVNDLPFRTSTPILNIISGSAVSLKITDSHATNSSNPLYATSHTFTANDTAIAILEGLLSLGYSPPRSSVPFNINIYEGAHTKANAGEVDILFHQGATDIDRSSCLEIPAKIKVFQNLEFGTVSGYKTIAINNYRYQIRETNSQSIIGEFSANFNTHGYGGKAIALLTSGFSRPNVNKFGSNLGLFVSSSNGGALKRLSDLSPTHARTQFIHNSADASVKTIDVWINDSLLYDNLSYLYCHAFEDFPADSNFVISITDSNSTDTTNSIIRKNVRISGSEVHIFILEGIHSSSGYTPGRSERPLNLLHIRKAAETALFKNNTDLGFHNGSTDLDLVDFYNSVIPSFMIIDNIGYQETSGYIPFLTKNFDLQMIRKREARIIAQFRLPLLNLGFQDSAGLVVTSGFMNPSLNSNGNDIGLYYAPPEGGPLLEFEKVKITSTLVQFLHNSPDLDLDSVDIYVNNRLRKNNLPFRHSTGFMAILSDTTISIKISPKNSENASNPIYSKNVNYDVTTSRYLIIEGVRGSGYNPPASSNPLNLKEIDGARILPNNPNKTDVLFYNGSTDIGVLDINESSTPIHGLADDLEYSEHTPFREMEPIDYDFELTDASGVFTALYDANFDKHNLSDSAIVVLTSGFLNPLQNNNGPTFGLYASLPGGGKFIKFPIIIGVGMNEANPEMSVMLYPNPSSGRIHLSSYLQKDTELKVEVYDPNGRLLHMELINAPKGEFLSALKLEHLSNGIYIMQISDENGLMGRNKFQILK